MAQCSICGDELVLGVNWLESYAKRHSYWCRTCVVKKGIEWAKKNMARHRESNRLSTDKIRVEVLTQYSGKPPKCIKCGYSDIRALSLDLMVNGHRKSGIPYGVKLYYRLRKEGYPKGWQVLCMNCQTIKEAKRRKLSRLKDKQQITPLHNL